MDTFIEFLEDHRGGALAEEIHHELTELVAAVKQHGKAGEVVITLKVEPRGYTLVITDTVKAKVPKATRESEIYFADFHGHLHRDDPAQQRLPFKTVETPTGVDVQMVVPATGEIIHPFAPRNPAEPENRDSND